MKIFNGFKKGMTLIELMVAFGVFSILITIAAGIFVRSLKISRFTSAQSAAINNVALTVEEIAREARTAFNFDKTTCSENTPTDCVSYTNYNNKNIVYKFNNDKRFLNYGTITKSSDGGNTYNPVTDPSVLVKGFFYVTENINGRITPRITVVADVIDSNNSPLVHIQTSISARLIYYK